MSISTNNLTDVVGSRLTIRQLTVFEAAVEQGSIAAAARVLTLTQPAVSKSVIDMETTLGVPLFKRTRQGVTLTEYGNSLLLHTRAIHAELRNAANDLLALSEAQGGHVVVGVSPVSTVLLARAILQLHNDRPRIRVTILDGTQDYVLNELGSGRLDFVLGRLATRSPKAGLTQTPLIEDPIRAFVRPGHPLSRRRRVELPDLADFSWVLPLPTSFVRSALEDAFSSEDVAEPPAIVETVSINAMRTLITDSDMIAFTPRESFLDELRQKHVAIIPVEFGQNFNPIGITLKKGVELSPPAKLLHDCFVAEAKKLKGGKL